MALKNIAKLDAFVNKEHQNIIQMKGEYHVKFGTIMQIIYQCERLRYFSNHIVITLNLANKGKKINWCSIMLTQMSTDLTPWIEHKKQIVVGLAATDKKSTTYYFGHVIMVCLHHWFPLLKEDTPIDSPKPQLVHG
jgi:hypothetical protein